jgi:Domain of unknown function (DUF4126)
VGWSSARRGSACRGVGYGHTEMETLRLAIANGWGCGISAYAVVLITGLVGRSGVADTPEALQRTDVLVAAAVLLAIEFVADKIPYVDSAWDSVHTVVRPAIGGVIGALLAGDASTLGQAVAAAGTGGMALASHLAKGGIRLAVNASPEPVTNVVASLTEDGAVAGVTLLAWEHPWIAAAIALVLLVAGASLAVFLVRRLRRGLARLAAWGSRPSDDRPP